MLPRNFWSKMCSGIIPYCIFFHSFKAEFCFSVSQAKLVHVWIGEIPLIMCFYQHILFYISNYLPNLLENGNGTKLNTAIFLNVFKNLKSTRKMQINRQRILKCQIFLWLKWATIKNKPLNLGVFMTLFHKICNWKDWQFDIKSFECWWSGQWLYPHNMFCLAYWKQSISTLLYSFILFQKGITSHLTIIVVYKHHSKKSQKTPKANNKTTKIHPKPEPKPKTKHEGTEKKVLSILGKKSRAFLIFLT